MFLKLERVVEQSVRNIPKSPNIPEIVKTEAEHKRKYICIDPDDYAISLPMAYKKTSDQAR